MVTPADATPANSGGIHSVLFAAGTDAIGVANAAADAAPAPTELTAATVQEWEVPLVSPFNTKGLDGTVPVMAVPPVGVHTKV